MGLMDHEVETLMVEAFGALPVPRWWVGVQVDAGLTVWTVVERDPLRPARLHALTVLREMIEELTEGECRIHAYKKLPKRSQFEESIRRMTRRW